MAEESSGVRKLTGPTLIANDLLKSLKRSNIRSKSYVNFLDREFCIFGTKSYITG